MTERRRFFPSKRRNIEPGQRVAVEVQLRPEGPAPKLEAAPAPEAPPPPPPPPACAVIGAGWIGLSVDEWGMQSRTLPDGRIEISDWNTRTVWSGAPTQTNSDGNPLPVPAEGFHCHEARVHFDALRPVRGGIHAVLQGTALSAAHWTFQWDGAEIGAPQMPQSIHYGGTIAVSTWGNVLQVVGNEVTYDGTEMTFSLTAWAHCGGEQVAELKLDIYFPGH